MKLPVKQKTQFSLIYLLIGVIVLSVVQSWLLAPRTVEIPMSKFLALVREGVVYQIALGAQLGLLLAAALGVGIARYYVLITWATVVSLVRYLRFGVPAVWAKAEGTR